MSERRVVLVLNGSEIDTTVAPEQTLLEVLRDRLGRTDVKYGCGEGVCGTCTVLLDGEPVSSCLLFAVQAAGHAITTVDGISGEPLGEALRKSLVEEGGVQCGFCTPGILITAYHLLVEWEKVSRLDIRKALDGNLCRCTGYSKIVDAIERCVTERGHGR